MLRSVTVGHSCPSTNQAGFIGPYLYALVVSFNGQHALYHDHYFVQFCDLRRFMPTGWCGHMSQAKVILLGMQASAMFVDNLAIFARENAASRDFLLHIPHSAV
jgi:hypothetical protein